MDAQRSPSTDRRFQTLRLGKLLLLVVFALSAAFLLLFDSILAVRAYQQMKEGTPANIDFPQLYAGGVTIVSDPRHVYDVSVMLENIREVQGLQETGTTEDIAGVLRYYNPPFFLLLLSPLSLLEAHVAYLLSIVGNLLAIAALFWFSGVALRWKQPATVLVGAAMSAFIPVHVALYNSEPNILIAVLLLVAFLAAESGRLLLASALLAMAAIKPQWGILPGLSFLRNRPHALLPFALVSSVLLLSPFIVLGIDAFVDYVHLFTDRASANLERPTYSETLYTWLGFFRAFTGSTQPVATLVMSLLSLAAFVIVLARGDRHLTWAAAVLATLISVPHGHSHEWTLAVPAAVFLLRRPMAPFASTVTAVLLLLGHLGMTVSVLALPLVRDGGHFVYPVVPIAFVLILWCAALPFVEERQMRARVGGPSSVAAT